nr:hypothetical protein HMPREF0276_1222 [Corynebacterium accolens ATCC 49725]
MRHEKCRGMRKVSPAWAASRVENFQSLVDDQRSSVNFDSATRPFKLHKGYYRAFLAFPNCPAA